MAVQSFWRGNKLAVLFLLAGACSHLAYYLIGARVENGVLVEPFGLVPLGYIFYLIGVLLYIFKLLR